MSVDLSKIPTLTRREIEARIVGPILRAFMDKSSREEALAVIRPIIADLARESGRAAARAVGGNTVSHYVRATEAWAADRALEQEVLVQTDSAFDWNVTRCAYAEMYKELGMQDLGFHLSCARDFAMLEGFNPRMSLTRTKTIMEGADCCDFRLRLQSDASAGSDK